MKKIVLIQLLLYGISLGSFAQDYTETIGEGNYLDVTITTSSANADATGEETLNGLGLLPNLNASSRFLAQATLGADYETIVATADKGFTTWLEEQLAMPVDFTLLGYCNELIQRHKDHLTANGEDPSGFAGSWVNSYFLYSWWKYAMTEPDVLRARVALALSEIVVVSAVPDFKTQPLGLASYYDLLVKHAFGNYRDLLYDVTLHPIMGHYLTHRNNRKTDLSKNRFPDENYAREIQQLFTIGLYELNIDGTRKLDEEGNPIPTYDNDDIAEFAKIFTGLSWGDRTSFGKCCAEDAYYSYTIPMQMFNSQHEPGEKTLLNGTVVPNRDPVDGIADINDALDNLFNHPNVGPFLARRLIQRLVTSNPSPNYIARVATAFNDNGQGVRGDMKAVVSAILTDPEARACTLNTNYSSKLKEPMIRHVQLLKSFNANGPLGDYVDGIFGSFYGATEQRPLYSPSVFNFFLPNFQPIGAIAGADLVAPEFQITHASTTIGYTNEVHKWIFDNKLVRGGTIFPDGPSADGDNKVVLDIAHELSLIEAGKIDELIERLNLVLVHGQMSEETKTIIKNAMIEVAVEGTAFQLDIAMYLTLISPDYLILK